MFIHQHFRRVELTFTVVASLSRGGIHCLTQLLDDRGAGLRPWCLQGLGLGCEGVTLVPLVKDRLLRLSLLI